MWLATYFGTTDRNGRRELNIAICYSDGTRDSKKRCYITECGISIIHHDKCWISDIMVGHEINASSSYLKLLRASLVNSSEPEVKFTSQPDSYKMVSSKYFMIRVGFK